jgi:hypothetical protein
MQQQCRELCSFTFLFHPSLPHHMYIYTCIIPFIKISSYKVNCFAIYIAQGLYCDKNSYYCAFKVLPLFLPSWHRRRVLVINLHFIPCGTTGVFSQTEYEDAWGCTHVWGPKTVRNPKYFMLAGWRKCHANGMVTATMVVIWERHHTELECKLQPAYIFRSTALVL